jgi:hypothetical protein
MTGGFAGTKNLPVFSWRTNNAKCFSPTSAALKIVFWHGFDAKILEDEARL